MLNEDETVSRVIKLLERNYLEWHDNTLTLGKWVHTPSGIEVCTDGNRGYIIGIDINNENSKKLINALTRMKQKYIDDAQHKRLNDLLNKLDQAGV